MNATCSACGAPILWAVTDRGKRTPLERVARVALAVEALRAKWGQP